VAEVVAKPLIPIGIAVAKRYIVALDQGTTSCRAVLFDEDGQVVGVSQQELTQHFPQPGWVEHDPLEIWKSQSEVFDRVVREHAINPSAIAAIGVTNQRETTILWNRKTGKPVCNAIVWQDRRTSHICEALKAAGMQDHVRKSTGLVIDPYFSGTKIKWVLDNVDGTRESARCGDLLFGTVDTWLIWKMTNGRVHATDYSNASRTLLYDINSLAWDSRLKEALEVPDSLLPEVRDSSGSFGDFEYNGVTIPICGVAGDQQAALFGQGCFDEGMAKNTYGTGCFLLLNTGERPCRSQNGLISTIAWGLDGKVTYALEGSILAGGAAIQWLRDGLKILDSAAESELLAMQAGDADEVCVVPAFAGLGAPHWDMYARGAILGLTRDTTRAQIVKATLESIAFQTRDVITAMTADTGIRLRKLLVDGGASANNFLMQFQADILGTPVERPCVLESTALGAACLAGIASGLWNQEQIAAWRRIDRTFTPSMTEATRQTRCARWQNAVSRSMNWVQSNAMQADRLL